MPNIFIGGAGPTGLTFALELRRLGPACEIIDKAEAGANISRAAIIHAHTHVRHPDADRSVRARWWIGCDGMHSQGRRFAGIDFEGGEYQRNFALADVNMDCPIPRDEVSLFFSPGGPVVVAPLPEDRFRCRHRAGSSRATFQMATTLAEVENDRP